MSRPDLEDPPQTWAVAPLTGRPGGAPITLREANLHFACLAGADLSDADLRRCDLTLADLRGANLRGARLAQADLSLANLQGADLRGADLGAADLGGADLRGARMQGADVSGTELAWAHIDGAQGTEDAWLVLPRSRGRVAGEAGPDGEPVQGMKAFARAQAAWEKGRTFAAERHLREALAWVPGSDVAWWHLGAVALERKDPLRAATCWQAALHSDQRADRARLDLALLRWAEGDPDGAQALLRVDKPGWFQDIADAARRGDTFSASQIIHQKLGASPGLAWLLRDRSPRQVEHGQPDDPEWAARERADLEAALRNPRQPAWVWHGAIARALTLGDLALAQRADQRLLAVAPEHRLWSLELQHLDLTAQALAELVRTRADGPGEVLSLRWVALGAHGPTAKILCTNGIFYAKRYNGQTRPAASVAYTHRVSRALWERGLRVPVALADDSGDDVMVFGQDLLALYPAVGDRPLDRGEIQPLDAARLGETLARIHLQGRDLGGSGRPRGGVRAGSRIVRSDNPRAGWLSAMGRDAACIAEFQRFPRSPLLLDLLEATSRRLHSVTLDCPVGLTHGDLAGGNALQVEAGSPAVAVVDWDLCDSDLLVWDLARTLDLIGVQWPDDPAQPEAFRPTVLRSALAAYHAVRPLHRAEQLALPVLIAASRVDLDAAVLPLCVRLEPAMGPPVWQRQLTRLCRAAAGAPELAEVLGPVW